MLTPEKTLKNCISNYLNKLKEDQHLPELQYGELQGQASRWLSHHTQHRHPASPWCVAVCVSPVVSWLVASQLLRDPGL